MRCHNSNTTRRMPKGTQKGARSDETRAKGNPNERCWKMFHEKIIEEWKRRGFTQGAGFTQGLQQIIQNAQKKQYQTLGPKFYWFNRTVITMSKNDPFWDLKTDSGSSRRALAFSGLKTRLGAQKKSLFWKFVCDLGFAGPYFQQTFPTPFLHLKTLKAPKIRYDPTKKKL